MLQDNIYSKNPYDTYDQHFTVDKLLAIGEYGHRNNYLVVYPVKVNRQYTPVAAIMASQDQQLCLEHDSGDV